jgi:hypothetical protein
VSLCASWLSPLVILIALALMIWEVGVSAIAGVALLTLLSPLQVKISKTIGQNRRRMLKFSDQRVKLMSEILQGVKVIKSASGSILFLLPGKALYAAHQVLGAF